MSWFSDALRWYGVLFAVSLAAAPWTLVIFRRLPDRGATIVRPLGVLAVIYPSWLLSSLDIISYSTLGLWITLGVLLASGWIYVVRNRLVNSEWVKKLAVVEVVSIAIFFAYIWLHGYTPEIMVTEKPMDEALLSASTIASQMPPNDPWLSGHPMNYYYLGYVVHGAVTRMADVVSSVGFTFALATTVSMTISAAAGVAFNIVRDRFGFRAALSSSGLAAFLVAIGGNLYAAIKFIQNPKATIDAAWWPYGGPYSVGWDSSRVVYDGGAGVETPMQTINEFPSFSFILADLHPHVMALPFAIASLSISLNLLLYRSDQDRTFNRSIRFWVTVALSGAFLGSLYALNSWDLPTFLGIGVVCLFLGLNLWEFRERLVAVGILVFAAVLAWLPFTATFVPLIDRDSVAVREGIRDIPVLSWLATTIGKVIWDRTSVGEFLTIFGIPYIACLILLGFALSNPDQKTTVRYPRIGFAVLFGVALLALIIPMPLLVLCGIPLACCLLLLVSREPASPLWIATAMFGLGFVIILTTEFFFIQDVFHNRMNTLFKAYYQVWTLFGIAASVAIVAIWKDHRRPELVRPAMSVLTFSAVALVAVYPVISARAWTNDFEEWKGVDGAAFIEDWSPAELAAIEWLRNHVTDEDVVLEQLGCSYQPNANIPRLSRAATFTGVPTVIGWAGHERQWRAGQQDLLRILSQREDDVQTMFNDPESDLIDAYNVTYIYVGKFETEGATESCPKAIPYSNAAEPTFPGGGWEEVFNRDEVRIYRRLEAN